MGQHGKVSILTLLDEILRVHTKDYKGWPPPHYIALSPSGWAAYETERALRFGPQERYLNDGYRGLVPFRVPWEYPEDPPFVLYTRNDGIYSNYGEIPPEVHEAATKKTAHDDIERAREIVCGTCGGAGWTQADGTRIGNARPKRDRVESWHAQLGELRVLCDHSAQDAIELLKREIATMAKAMKVKTP